MNEITTIPAKKITIKSDVITQIEREIEVPYFFKDGLLSAYYKIGYEGTVINVVDFDDYGHISKGVCKDETFKSLLKGKQITEEQFNQVYYSALSKIQNL